ncbi:glyceraldehyde-3-phosphate dehydrogenase [Reichenbachiella sp. MSK19-1]|nr:glyceraldehyde-3-phosphate dehydrogenase [Reichenbachiella sp. MSK19-1]
MPPRFMFFIKRVVLLSLVLAASFSSYSQRVDKKSALRDSLDHKLDASDFLMTANGFIPLLQFITEPSLGSFGLAFSPIFIHPNKYQEKGRYVPPNITVAFVAYTANQSWMLGAMRIASLPKYGLKYRIGAGYGSVNMDFYRNVGGLGDKKFSFNFRSIPIFGSLTKEIGKTNIYAGIEYFYMDTDLSPEFGFTSLPDFVSEKSLKSHVSSPGVLVEYDMRDNSFTPNKGTMLSSNFRINAAWTGSDFEFTNLDFKALQYFQTTPSLVSGFRFESQLQYGKAPFYLNPGVNLRGVPMARYQGQSVYLLETEQRYDFTMRWSGVVFTGMAKAVPKETSFSDATLVYNYGTGFRYLIARKFGLRMGVDVAASNDDFGYYIVFGSAWNNRG